MQIENVKNSSINFASAKVVQNIRHSKPLKKLFLQKINAYPKDLEYIKIIGKNVNISEASLYKLNSIIGPQELESILAKENSSAFDPGAKIFKGKLSKENLETLAKQGFCYNLHIHTTNSDGKMSVRNLLDQAAEYANILANSDKNKKRFIIALTDHDNLNGNKEALKIIAKNPTKYKNLGIVLGAELSAIYNNSEMLAKPFAYELVAYSINPFDTELNKNLTTLRNNRISLSKNIIKEAQELYPEYDFSYDEACKQSNNPKKGIDGFLYSLSEYFSSKDKNSDIKRISLKYLPKVNEKNNITNIAEELFKIIKESFGFLGIAHPGKIYLGNGKINNNFIDKCKKENKSSGKIIIETFLAHLKKVGGNKFRAIETNYQSYDGNLAIAQQIINGKQPKDETYNGAINWLNIFNNFVTQNNMLRTGGLDTHSENPFLKK